MRQPSFVYSIDHNDSLLYVDEPWLAFARENRAPELTRDHVLGRSLWEFVAGAETRLLYESLFLKLRTSSGSIELPFRCDSPDRFRFMRLILESGPRESIRMTGILERERERPYFTILDRAFPRTRSTLRMCSMCLRIFAYGAKWLELENAIRELDLFDSSCLPELAYAICEDCLSADRHTPGNAAT